MMPYIDNFYDRIIEQYKQDIYDFKKMPETTQEEEQYLLKELENTLGYLIFKRKLYKTYCNNLNREG